MIKVDFKNSAYKLQVLRNITNTRKNTPILGLGIYSENRIVGEEIKTVIYSFIKIYDYKKFSNEFDCKWDSIVPASSEYEAILPCIIYTDLRQSFSWNVVLDIIPSKLTDFNRKYIVLTGGGKISPCQDLFFNDVPIFEGRKPVNFIINKKEKLEHDFITLCIDVRKNLIDWKRYLGWKFHVLGSHGIISDVLGINNPVYVVKFSGLNE